MLTEDRILDLCGDRRVNINDVRELAKVSAEYEKVFEQLVESRGTFPDIEIERELDRKSTDIRKRLGIHFEDPCGGQKCDGNWMKRRGCMVFVKCVSYDPRRSWCKRFDCDAKSFNNPTI
jgi:hypothetical protein